MKIIDFYISRLKLAFVDYKQYIKIYGFQDYLILMLSFLCLYIGTLGLIKSIIIAVLWHS